MFKFSPLFILVLALTGCTTMDPSPVGSEKTTPDRLENAFISPLNDLNIVQINISPIIADALKNPYKIPADISCLALGEKIHQLDTALGADFDTISSTTEKTNSEKGSEFVQDEAIGSVERTINGVIPFRSWIRKLSGAEKHSKDLAAAVAAGVVRRAFLKGIGQAHGCEPPAAPLKNLPSNEKKNIPPIMPTPMPKEAGVVAPATNTSLIPVAAD